MVSMDLFSKLLVFLATIYVLFARERHIRASAQGLMMPSAQPGPSDILYLDPKFEKNSGDSSISDDLYDEFIAGPREQQKAEPSFWRQIEGQIFMAELLNLTKNQFNQFEPDQSMQRLDKCQKLNVTIDKTQKQISDLLELTILERSYRMADLQGKNWIKSAAKHINSPSPARQQQMVQVFVSLNEFVSLFFQCLASIEAGDKNFKDQRYDTLHNDLLPLTDYMRKIGSLFESGKQNTQQNPESKFINGLFFTQILPENNDFEYLDKLKEDKRHSSLLGKLNSAFEDLKLRMINFVNENKDFLDPKINK